MNKAKNQLTEFQLKICELTTPKLFEKYAGVKVTSTAMEAVVALMCRVMELEAKIEQMENEQIREAVYKQKRRKTMEKELEGIIEYATKEYDKRVANEILEQLGKGINIDDIFVITDEMWCKDFQVVTRKDATDPSNWPIGNGGYDRIPNPDEDFESAEKWIQDSFEEYCEACGCCGVVVESGTPHGKRQS